jgi:hypothetical protein
MLISTAEPIPDRHPRMFPHIVFDAAASAVDPLPSRRSMRSSAATATRRAASNVTAVVQLGSAMPFVAYAATQTPTAGGQP